MEDKILEIVKDNGVLHTRYCTLNAPGLDAVFFEGRSLDDKRLQPLAQAKKWATEKGYTHMLLISTTRRKSNRLYKLKKLKK